MFIRASALLFFLARAVLAQQPTPIRPDPKLTPGDSFPVTVQDLCVSGYTKKVRNVPAEMKREVYEEYGVTSYRSGDYEVDHLIRSNSVVQIQLKISGRSRTEHYLGTPKLKTGSKVSCMLVCSGQLDLKPLNRPSPQTGSERINSMSARLRPPPKLLRLSLRRLR